MTIRNEDGVVSCHDRLGDLQEICTLDVTCLIAIRDDRSCGSIYDLAL